MRKSMDGVNSIRDIEDWLRDSANFSKSEAQTFISRFKSALLSDSEAEKQLALLAKSRNKRKLKKRLMHSVKKSKKQAVSTRNCKLILQN